MGSTSVGPSYFELRQLLAAVVLSAMKHLLSIIRYTWAAPASAVGLFLLVLPLCLGATCRVVDGVAEVAGGRVSRIFPFLPRTCHFEAITFGHVVIGLDHDLLTLLRPHEHAHVRQYERWGILFIPLYLYSRASQVLCGRNPYLHNRFEKEAFAKAATTSGIFHASSEKSETGETVLEAPTSGEKPVSRYG